MRFRRNKAEKVELDVTKIGASRAMYIDADIQRVEVRILTSDNFEVILSLTPHQTAELIEQMTMSYYAINPPLRTRRETFGN